MKTEKAFTLVEMLAVMAIIAILVTFVAPAASSIAGGSKISQAEDAIVGLLNQARQAALTQDQTVEVRFYQYGDPEAPGEKADNPASGHYRAVQVFQIDDAGNAKALSKVQTLPQSITIDSGNTLSSIISRSSTPKPTVSLPRVGTRYNSASFRFTRDGSTDLPRASSDRWFLTLHDLKAGDGLATPPANFATIQVDPLNGSVKTFRP